MSTITSIIPHSFGGPSYSNEKRETNKEIQLGKEVKLSLFADDTVLIDSVTPWTVARQAPLPMEFSRQEYWSE